MKERLGFYYAAAWLLLLAGCASAPPQTTGTPEGQPGEGIILSPVPNSEMSNNRAVVALLDRAQTDNSAGRQEAAEGSLERGLRIEPRNPWLWQQLAQLRYDQGKYAQAITLARKSNSFARGDNRIQAGNWELIGNARVAMGDKAGADDAFKRAVELAEKIE